MLRNILYKKYDDSIREIKTKKKILDIKSLYLYELGLFMFKFNINLLQHNFDNYYKSIKNVHNYHTRIKKKSYLDLTAK